MNDMEYTDKEYCLEVWGDWACFTRPELKVERVSYDVITPSAARAIFEAILFKRYAMRSIYSGKRPSERGFCQASAKCGRESYEVLSDVRTQGITRAMFYAALSRMS